MIDSVAIVLVIVMAATGFYFAFFLIMIGCVLKSKKNEKKRFKLKQL